MSSPEGEPTVRWRLDVRYDGTGFSGWAAQDGRRTVQGELETWLSRLLRLPQPPRLVCAGRTDAGVHARGQVAHVDLPGHGMAEPGAAEELRRRLARALPRDVVVTRVQPAPPGFDARFAALWRRYCYRLSDPDTPYDPLWRGQVVDHPLPLDVGLLTDAGTRLLGLRDFAAFCRRREGASTVRTLLELSAHRVPAGPLVGVIEVDVRADAFCHSMVRSLVGGLVEVGSGRRDIGWLVGVAAEVRRSGSVPVMPARGLTLEQVAYPQAPEELGARARASRRRRELPDG
jgi:tRNA pseudouridine38-40 synthase